MDTWSVSRLIAKVKITLFAVFCFWETCFILSKCHSVTLAYICFHSTKHSPLSPSLLQPSLMSEKQVLFPFIHHKDRVDRSDVVPKPEEDLGAD